MIKNRNNKRKIIKKGSLIVILVRYVFMLNNGNNYIFDDKFKKKYLVI